MDIIMDYVGFALFLVGGIFLIGLISDHVVPKIESVFWDIWEAHTEHNQLRCYQCGQLIENNDDSNVCIECGGFSLLLKTKK